VTGEAHRAPHHFDGPVMAIIQLEFLPAFQVALQQLPGSNGPTSLFRTPKPRTAPYLPSTFAVRAIYRISNIVKG